MLEEVEELGLELEMLCVKIGLLRTQVEERERFLGAPSCWLLGPCYLDVSRTSLVEFVERLR